MIVVMSESPQRLYFSIVRSNDYACLLSNYLAIDNYELIGHSRLSIM